MRQILRVATALVGLLLLSGCAGMRLYSDTRDKQGQTATKAWSEVDLAGYFAAQREERKKLLQAELDAITLHVMANRENELRLIANDTVANFQAKIDKEVFDLVGAGGLGLDNWMDLNEELQTSRKEQADARTRLAAARQQQFTCTIAKTKPTVPGDAEPALASLVSACDREEKAGDALNRLNDGMGGLVKDDWTAIKVHERAIEVGKTRAQQQVAAYKAAAKAYEDAVNSEQSPATKPSENVAKVAGTLRAAIAGLLDLKDAFGREAQAKERVNTLDELLEKVEEGADPGKDASNKEVVALMLPKIADDLKAMASLNSSTPKAALLIRRDIEKGRAAVAQMEVAFEEQRLSLARAILSSRVEEAILINLAGTALKPALLPELKSLKYYLALKWNLDPKIKDDATLKAKVALYDAPGRYLDAIGRQRAHARKLELMRMAVTHERAIGYAEVNAGQWAALIGSVVGQASEFAAGGQKFSDYKDLVQTLTLLWIGKGVNE